MCIVYFQIGKVCSKTAFSLAAHWELTGSSQGARRSCGYAWTPCHKFFEVVRPFTATGPAEVKRLVDMITPLVVGATKDPTDKRKQLFSKCAHITMDNLFSSDEVLRYLGEGGWKGTMTCRRDRLPKSVPRKYFNFIKAAPVNARPKVA